jgi:hypothetical protein
VLIVVETEGAGRAALLVDSIVDQRQVVIKSLDTHYRSVEGVAGATILGDGRVALIVDVDGLSRAAWPNTASLICRTRTGWQKPHERPLRLRHEPARVSPGLRRRRFQAISEIAHREAGIVLPPGKAMLVYSRLAPLVRDSGCQTFAPMSCAFARMPRNAPRRSARSPPTTRSSIARRTISSISRRKCGPI